MKRINRILFLAAMFFLVFNDCVKIKAQDLADVKGAWKTDALEYQTTMICSEKYFSVALYDLGHKKFIGTHGGTYRIENGDWIALIEYHTTDPELIGKEIRQKVTLEKRTLTFAEGSENVLWKQLDDGTPGKLGGAWLITGRVRNGEMSTMTPGVRRTMKILSGTRFQWIAYNVDTKEFSATGGGTYTTRDGKYTENVEFFSKDSSRVGASLTFDFSLEDGRWRHRGSGSKGDSIDEVWTKREKTGL